MPPLQEKYLIPLIKPDIQINVLIQYRDLYLRIKIRIWRDIFNFHYITDCLNLSPCNLNFPKVMDNVSGQRPVDIWESQRMRVKV